MVNTMKLKRQERAAERLDAQLKSGVKPEKQKNFAGISTTVMVPLTESDLKRINKERAVLKVRTGK